MKTNLINNRIHIFSFLFFLIFPVYGVFSQRDTIAVDYSKPYNWAVLPGNYPEQLERFGAKSLNDSIDVFFVYPTLLTDKKDKRWNVEMEDSVQHKMVLNGPIQFQLSAFFEAGNIYAPFYRQAHLRSYYELEKGGKEALMFAYEDVKSAFEYYLEHYNKGKGIILVGHSQGSTHLGFILRDYFDGKELQNKLIAAYIPGIGFEKNQFQTIPLMTDSSQTGGFVTWNTFKRKLDKESYVFYKNKACINPVTWDTTKVAGRELHKGFLFSNGKFYDHSFSTHLGNGIIWISTPHFPFRYLVFTMKHYHVGDINLFWEDIRLNALNRVKSYKEQQ
ncbi:MAG: hypothetical protein RI922_2803 [Bacteroidota bacterium]|jgi:hypothetical protein